MQATTPACDEMERSEEEEQEELMGEWMRRRRKVTIVERTISRLSGVEAVAVSMVR